MSARNAQSDSFAQPRSAAAGTTLIRSFNPAREKVVNGWLRITFFLAILLHRAVTNEVLYQFPDQRMLLVWLDTLRDFGVVGFFLLAGVALRGKTLANDRAKLPSNLLKLAVAAAALAAFDMAFVLLKGGTIDSVKHYYYDALYESNLWFFVAYAFAAPLLFSLDRRGVLLTGLACALFVLYPGFDPLFSPYILQSISFAFICMAIGMQLYGRIISLKLSVPVAILAYLVRVWTDDYGAPLYPSMDIVLKIVYGISCFMICKRLADLLCVRLRPPGWATYLFVPYIVQVPVVTVIGILATMFVMGTYDVRMPPIYLSFWESFRFSLSIFALSAVASFVLAWLLHRFRIRV